MLETLFNKAAGMELYLKETPTRCFPVKIAEFVRTPFFIEHPWWLFLSVHIKEERVIDSMYIKYIC